MVASVLIGVIIYIMFLSLDTTLIYFVYSCLSSSLSFLPDLCWWHILGFVFIIKIFSGDLDNYIGAIYPIDEEEEF